MSKGAVADEQKMGKQELEQNVRVSEMWRSAVRRAQITGSDAHAIGSLLAFLDEQHKTSLAQYEAESLKHPDWGRPSDIPGAKA